MRHDYQTIRQQAYELCLDGIIADLDGALNCAQILIDLDAIFTGVVEYLETERNIVLSDADAMSLHMDVRLMRISMEDDLVGIHNVELEWSSPSRHAQLVAIRGTDEMERIARSQTKLGARLGVQAAADRWRQACRRFDAGDITAADHFDEFMDYIGCVHPAAAAVHISERERLAWDSLATDPSASSPFEADTRTKITGSTPSASPPVTGRSSGR